MGLEQCPPSRLLGQKAPEECVWVALLREVGTRRASARQDAAAGTIVGLAAGGGPGHRSPAKCPQPSLQSVKNKSHGGRYGG